ncbi:MAG: hypothetical protein Q9182_005135 [Xanthomendoza sp. 2 TL-2023]
MLAGYSKNEPMTEVKRLLLVITKGMISVEPVVTNQPTFGVMVWGLQDVGRQIVERYPMPERTPTLKSIVSAGGLLKGRILIQRPRRPPPPPSKVATPNGEAAFNMVAKSPVTAIERRVNADEGIEHCADDVRLVIYYHFQHQPLVPGQVFTAFLTANTFCSDHGDGERDVSMVAISLGNHVRIRLEGMGDPFANQLTWRMARLALKTIWETIVMGFKPRLARFGIGPRWESCTFLLSYDGVRVGEGWLDNTGSFEAPTQESSNS